VHFLRMWNMRLVCDSSLYVTARLLTVDPFVNRSARFKTGRGRAESESGSISRPAWLESGSISRPARLESGSISRPAESGPARALDGLYYNRAFSCDITVTWKPYGRPFWCIQLNGDLVCCIMRVQNAAQTWQLMDLPHKYVRYRYPVHVICET